MKQKRNYNTLTEVDRSFSNSTHKAMHKDEIKDAVQIDMNTLNRMPVGALNILNDAEKNLLEKKQIIYSIIDSFIFLICCIFLGCSFIEQKIQEKCKFEWWEAFSGAGVVISLISLIIDFLTL